MTKETGKPREEGEELINIDALMQAREEREVTMPTEGARHAATTATAAATVQSLA